MGLFEKKKKDAERCPICGKEISFFSGLVIADGTICDDCEKMVRGQFNIEEYYGRENWKISTSDPLKAMTVEELKDMINEKKAEQTQVVEEIGGDYAAIAKVEKTFGIAPKATDVGLKRAKALKNRIVATSYIMSGEFSRGDAVTVSFDGADMTTTILDVIECSSSSTFETALNATFGKHKATGVYPNATGLTEVAMGVTEDICTFKVPLNYVLAGGYYDENNEEHTIQGLNSATTIVEEALAAGSFSTGNHMMIWANVTEQDLYKEKEIETSFGETLSWEYLCYVREHPVVWNIPTKILYGDKDNLTSYETMSDFASKMGISLTVMNNGEHWFHTDEQMNFLDDWICESNR